MTYLDEENKDIPAVEEEPKGKEQQEERNPNYTYFDEIYKMFLSMVDDYTFDGVDDEVLDKILLDYFDGARQMFINFLPCDMYDVDMDDKHFNFKMVRYDMTLLAKAMKLEWVRSKEYSEELMTKSIGDRDYNAIQGYPLLKELRNTDKQLTKEINIMRQRREYGQADLLGEMVAGG